MRLPPEITCEWRCFRGVSLAVLFSQSGLENLRLGETVKPRFHGNFHHGEILQHQGHRFRSPAFHQSTHYMEAPTNASRAAGALGARDLGRGSQIHHPQPMARCPQRASCDGAHTCEPDSRSLHLEQPRSEQLRLNRSDRFVALVRSAVGRTNGVHFIFALTSILALVQRCLTRGQSIQSIGHFNCLNSPAIF